MAKRESILDNIETVLDTITTANGYNNDIGLATRETTDWMRLQPKQIPAAIIQWTKDEREPRDVQGHYLISTLTVVIRGVIAKVRASDDMEQKVNEFSEDIEKALAVDGTRGGHAMHTNPADAKMYNLPPESNRAVFDATFIIKYQYSSGSP